MDIKRIGVGSLKDPGIDHSIINPQPGYFTFDNKTITFDSLVDTFDFDIVLLPPVVKRDYSERDYLEIDYK
ncbi:hypothetical protein CFS9_02950 [Flavobacterium sp. CFS9]|uniref:Agmatinase n=1 Tax=Flavobacterium sp. CFS9 TaxID=3143118 RepID=A0AAT9GW41_9FLAO